MTSACGEFSGDMLGNNRTGVGAHVEVKCYSRGRGNEQLCLLSMHHACPPHTQEYVDKGW